MLVQKLTDRHAKKEFDCGETQLNDWLRKYAKQHKEKGLSTTFVMVNDKDSSEILGFYAISLTELFNADLPEQLRKRLPQRVPAFRLGRLATAKAHQGKGIGETMLFDAIERVTRLSAEIGGTMLIVNAKPSAISFYSRYGFEQMESHPQNSFLRIF
jgi:GNAT superfamily N-acetyltransferase